MKRKFAKECTAIFIDLEGVVSGGLYFECHRIDGHKGHHSSIEPFTWWD